MEQASATKPETTRQRCERRMSGLQSERSSWEPHWRDLARFFLPRRGRFMLAETNRGQKRHQDIINGRSLFAARTLASGLMAGLTSPGRPWFRLTTPDPDLAEFGAVKQWLSVTEQRMRDVFTKSNLYQTLPVYYHELGVFGTASMAALEDARDTVRFQPFTIGSYYLAQDHQGTVATFSRKFRLSVRQAVMQFGPDNVSMQTKQAYERGDYDKHVDVCHLIEPNDSPMPDMLDKSGMPWRSCYWEMGRGDDVRQKMLSEKGYRENPILAARWSVTAEDVYGSSPGMDALGDTKALQVQEKRKAMAIDKHIDPPTSAPGILKNNRVSLLPGDVTYLDNPNAKIESIYQTDIRLQSLLEDIQALERRIDTAMYADLFLMLTLDNRAQRATAEEIRAQEQEKLLMLGPVLERLNFELLDRLIDRVFMIMLRAGKLPPPPEELQGVDLRVEYISILAQAQKAVALQQIDRLVGYAGSVAQYKPEVLDKIDFDQSIDEMGSALGTPPRLIRDDKAVSEIRASRQQAEQAAQAAAMAQPAAQAAGAAAKLAETQPADDNMLERMAAAGSVQ